MSEENSSFFDRLLGTNQESSERERKVLEYIIHRVNDGAHLRDVTQEEYVRRNASQAEIDDILQNPRLVHSVHEQMREDFAEGGVLSPEPPPSSAQ